MSRWTDSHDKWLLLQLLDPEVTVSRARFAELSEKLDGTFSSDTIRLSKMPTWDDNLEKTFLLLMLMKAGDLNVTKTVAEVAPVLGPDYSPEYLRQRFYKLKRESESLLVNAGVTPATPSAKKSKSIPAKSTPAKSPGKRKATTANTNDAYDDATTNDTPVPKRTKKDKKKKDEDAVDVEDVPETAEEESPGSDGQVIED